MSESIRTALTRIEAGIEAVRDSEKFRQYLAFCGRFHRYSFANQMLIWSQRSDATVVAGFHAWLDLKRYVRKGEKGIMILAPRQVKRPKDEQQEDGEAKTFTYFRPVYIFDVSQTEGEPLPSLVETLKGEDLGDVWKVLAQIAQAEGLTIDRSSRDEQANGFYVHAERLIWVSPALEPMHAAKTLAHELSHHFARHHEQQHDREDAEMIAESSAYIVMSHLGCDSGEYSFGYLASWGDAALFRQRLEEIHNTAEAIIARLEPADEG